MKNMKLNKVLYFFVLSLVFLVALDFGYVSFANAATQPLYLTPSNGSSIGVVSTNTLSGDRSLTGSIASDPPPAANYFRTLFTKTAPSSTTESVMRVTCANAGQWYWHSRIIYNRTFSSDAYISSGVKGSFYLRSNSTNDKYRFKLFDYNPADGSYTLISTSSDVNSPGTATTLVSSINFNNAATTLPQGHYLAVGIDFKPYAANNTGRVVYDRTTRQSKIDVEIKFSLTSSSGSNGSITGPSVTPGVAYVDMDSTPSYAISANGGYTIQSLLVDGVGVPGAVGQTSYTYNFSAISGNHTIAAAFVVTTVSFNIAPGAGGYIGYGLTPPYSFNWVGGTTYTYVSVAGVHPFSVVANSGYGIEWVKLDGVDQGVPYGQTTPYPLSIDIGLIHTLSASFLPYYTVTASAGTGGSISPVGDTAVLSGQTINFDITPDYGYRILSILDNGVNVGTTTPYTISNVTSNHTIVVSFAPVHAIQAIAGPNGTISPIGEVLVDNATDRSFSITPNIGYRINSVIVDGVSVGTVSNYTFTNVTGPHTIEATFVASPIPSTYCAVPPYINTAAPPHVMLMLSVETPMQGPANPNVTCTGTPSSPTFSCNTSSSSCSSNGALGCYTNTKNYYGYFDSDKCYSYSGSAGTGLFSPSGAASSHQCGGTAWSGNFLNWMSTTAVDAFRKAFTGGNRAVDTTTETVLLGARLDDSGYYPSTIYIDNAQLYTPYSGTRYFKRRNIGIGFGVCNAGQTDCTITSTGSGETKWPVASTNTEAVFSLRIKACDPTGGVESRCNTTTNKPEGTIQKYMDKMRFALMSYAADNSQARDGGVLRAPMKWVSPVIINGMKYHDASGNQVTCSLTAGCANPEKEVDTNGIFVSNPDGATGANSGVINYINKFAYSAGYKGYDPMGELYYEVVRYFRNLTPSDNNYCHGLTTTPLGSFSNGDGFAYYCNSSKTNKWGWRDPALYSCSKNYVIAINDANPWLDKRIPGSAFTGSYGGSGDVSTDYCGSSLGGCDTDFGVDVLSWTNRVGSVQGLTPGNMKVGCVWSSGLDCTTAYNAVTSPYTGMNASQAKYVTELGRVIGTYPSAGKYNSYNVAGLAYYAHMTDLRPDFGGTTAKRNLTTYMIDTQEPGGSMLVGPSNMLYLAAKFGGFEDKDNDQSVTVGGTRYNSPYSDATCGGVSSTPNSYCSEWDANNDGYPDNYFFASEAAKVENALNTAFSSILNRASAGTAAAVANNRSGERGANVIQAMFYPQWPLDENIKWLGDVQALWFYLDPLVQYSAIYEDTDQNAELNLDSDLVPGTDSLALKAIWKAGPVLHARSASSRTIYTNVSATPPLTPINLSATSANEFSTTNRSTLKPLMNLSSVSDPVADSFINYVRGTDSGSYRSRTLSYKSTTNVWKLGDIINSTPQIQSSVALNAYNTLYNDKTYSTFTSSNQYKANNMTYVGSNDGMLHAFRLGVVQTISDKTNKFRIANIVDDTDLGKEEWAFIPRNVLPYLANCADSGYCHQYLVDGTPLLSDESIYKHSSCGSDGYWDCIRQTTLDVSKNVDLSQTSWRTMLIGSMGHGGATRDGDCNETLSPDAISANNTDCIKTPVSGNGFSSYFALDVTTPISPKFMWEFSDAALPAVDRGLGLSTAGPAILRLKTGAKTNGRRFVVMASGQTGPIDQGTHQIKGRSDQNLKIYVVDMNPFTTTATNFVKCTAAGQVGCNYWVFDTGVKYAFANSLYNATIDLDRSNSLLSGYYSDDVLYITYTKATLNPPSPTAAPQYPTAWDKGGILRLITNNSPDPANWFVSTLIDDIGPVTSNVDILQNRNKKELWLYFGEGRYFYTGDDLNTTRRIFGVKDPCYRNGLENANTFNSTLATCPSLNVTDLNDVTFIPNASSVYSGWYIDLTAASGSDGAERLFGKVSAGTNGVVKYPTFIPNTDICAAGGASSLWAVQYSTGGTPPASSLDSKIFVTTSDGPIPRPLSLRNALTRSGGRQLDSGLSIPGAGGGGGGGGGGGFPDVKKRPPVKSILNIQER